LAQQLEQGVDWNSSCNGRILPDIQREINLLFKIRHYACCNVLITDHHQSASPFWAAAVSLSSVFFVAVKFSLFYNMPVVWQGLGSYFEKYAH
jgi:hypothetical protein